MTLPADVARCPGYQADGEWRDGCEDCLTFCSLRCSAAIVTWRTPSAISPQWWLAEVDQHGNPNLVDGSHDTREGADQAAYLYAALGLAKPGVRYAVARVELAEPQPSSRGVNRRTAAPVDPQRVVCMAPPLIVDFECEYRIDP